MPPALPAPTAWPWPPSHRLPAPLPAPSAAGIFPDELKRAGYDMVIVEGKAEKPTYLSIKDGEVRFRNAAKFSGMQTTDTQLFIKDELKDQNYRVACIGPAGEKLVPMACIVNERRAAGSKGLGAVMGSKNLKAIAVRGTGKPSIVDPARFQEDRKSMLKAMKDSHILVSLFFQRRHANGGRYHHRPRNIGH